MRLCRQAVQDAGNDLRRQTIRDFLIADRDVSGDAAYPYESACRALPMPIMSTSLRDHHILQLTFDAPARQSSIHVAERGWV